ncbi:hypothetical protein CPLU01_08386 [Colletotrichum plurivorum]|uniref:Uncharacterized protein n=1 Tax=Colletotrichum plurivorum TaxID=2175906 RepID=A0A8H6NCL7_9PEZI|nr:hypothetical protein CPLU01_08386 [Colletotrichum plurivorum]
MTAEWNRTWIESSLENERSMTKPAKATFTDLLTGVNELVSQRETTYASWWPDLVSKLQRRQRSRAMHRLARKVDGTAEARAASLTLLAADQFTLLEEEVVPKIRELLATAEWLIRGVGEDPMSVQEVVDEVWRLRDLVDRAEVLEDGDAIMERSRGRGVRGTCWEYFETKAYEDHWAGAA